MRFVFLVILLYAAVSSSAEVRHHCGFEITCPDNFKLDLSSKSNDCSESDVFVSFIKGGQKKETFPITPDWFVDIENIGNIETSCTSTNYSQYPIFIQDEHAVLFLRKMRKPDWDEILVVLFNIKTGKMIDQLELGSTMRKIFGVVKSTSGYKMQMIKENNKEMHCHCDAAVIEDWLEIRVKNNKLEKSWIK